MSGMAKAMSLHFLQGIELGRHDYRDVTQEQRGSILSDIPSFESQLNGQYAQKKLKLNIRAILEHLKGRFTRTK